MATLDLPPIKDVTTLFRQDGSEYRKYRYIQDGDSTKVVKFEYLQVEKRLDFRMRGVTDDDVKRSIAEEIANHLMDKITFTQRASSDGSIIVFGRLMIQTKMGA